MPPTMRFVLSFPRPMPHTCFCLRPSSGAIFFVIVQLRDERLKLFGHSFEFVDADALHVFNRDVDFWNRYNEFFHLFTESQTLIFFSCQVFSARLEMKVQ